MTSATRPALSLVVSPDALALALVRVGTHRSEMGEEVPSIRLNHYPRKREPGPADAPVYQLFATLLGSAAHWVDGRSERSTLCHLQGSMRIMGGTSVVVQRKRTDGDLMGGLSYPRSFMSISSP
jgi:hypothetical protein